MRIFVISGAGGKGLSAGMLSLMPRLEQYGVPTFHDWNDSRSIVEQINRTGETVTVIAYSQGGFDLYWFENANRFPGFEHEPVLKRSVQLGVAYDPRGSLKAKQNLDGEYVLSLSMFDHVIDYHNRAWWLWPFMPPIRFEGANVQTIDIYTPHPLVQVNGWCHDYTIEAVKRLAETGKA